MKSIVLKRCNEMLRNPEIERKLMSNTKISRGLGIYSLGVVLLILSVYEKLYISLDDYLICILSNDYSNCK